MPSSHIKCSFSNAIITPTHLLTALDLQLKMAICIYVVQDACNAIYLPHFSLLNSHPLHSNNLHLLFPFFYHHFMMLNPAAPPFEHNPPPHSAYYYCHYQNPPQLQNYHHATCFRHPQPLSPYFNNNIDHLALQFSHISLTTAEVQLQIQQHPPPPPPPPPLPPRSPRQQQQNISMRGRRNLSTMSCQSTLEFDESKLDVEIRTTVMIKNIPNRLNRDLLITLLDHHCAEENCRAAVEGSPLSEYDFIYLPMDFQSKGNLGYAFVNLTTPVAGWRLFRALNGRRWVIFSSAKTAQICYARIQGKEALLDNFRGSCFVCQDDKYLPAVLSPPRNGTTSLTAPAAVGKRVWQRR